MLEEIYNKTGAENIIIVNSNILALYKAKDDFKQIIKTKVFIGKRGLTSNKKEGDLKTPNGLFNIGISFGINELEVDRSLKYVKLNKNLYWVDDINSMYYNRIVDITKY